MASDWISVDTQLGWTAPGTIDDSALVPVGTIARFRDIGTTQLGTGEFIYLKGVGSTVLGSWVTYSISDGTAVTGTTTLWAGTANLSYPLAVATAATVANKYGWYQISGAAVCAISGSIAAGNPAAWQAAGVVQATPVTTKNVVGAIALSAHAVPAANKAIYLLSRPSSQPAA